MQNQAIYKEMVATFCQLQHRTRVVTYKRRSDHRWLNEQLKMNLIKTFSSPSAADKRKQSAVVTNNDLPPRKNTVHGMDPSFLPLTLEEADELVSRSNAANDSTKTSGLASLLG
jgi:hypothetical protein